MKNSLTEINVVSSKGIHSDFSEHAVIFNLRFSEGRAVVGDENQFSFAVPDRFNSAFESQERFPGSHHELQFGVDIFLGRLLYHFSTFIVKIITL
jgi:hypothetical protein